MLFYKYKEVFPAATVALGPTEEHYWECIWTKDAKQSEKHRAVFYKKIFPCTKCQEHSVGEMLCIKEFLDYWSYLLLLCVFQQQSHCLTYSECMGFLGGSDGKESTCSMGDLGSISGLGRSPGGGHGNPLQYSCLENPPGQRSLVRYNPWSCKELDITERLSTVNAYWKRTSVTCQWAR